MFLNRAGIAAVTAALVSSFLAGCGGGGTPAVPSPSGGQSAAVTPRFVAQIVGNFADVTGVAAVSDDGTVAFYPAALSAMGASQTETVHPDGRVEFADGDAVTGRESFASPDGWQVGSTTSPGQLGSATLWLPGDRPVDLNAFAPSGYRLTNAFGINPEHQIVCFGLDEAAVSRGGPGLYTVVLLTPVP